MKRRRATLRDEGGFTLVELAVAALVLAIITAAAVPVYTGYVNEVRFVAAQQMAGAVHRALEACVQSKGAGSTCSRNEVLTRVGATPAGATPDGRWIIETATLSLGSTPGAPMTGSIRLVGVPGKDTENFFVALSPPSAEIVTGFVPRAPGGTVVTGGGSSGSGGGASAGSDVGASSAKPATPAAASTPTAGPAEGSTSTTRTVKPTSTTAKPTSTTGTTTTGASTTPRKSR